MSSPLFVCLFIPVHRLTTLSCGPISVQTHVKESLGACWNLLRYPPDAYQCKPLPSHVATDDDKPTAVWACMGWKMMLCFRYPGVPQFALRADMSTSKHSSCHEIACSIVCLEFNDCPGQSVTMSRQRNQEGLVGKKGSTLSLAWRVARACLCMGMIHALRVP